MFILHICVTHYEDVSKGTTSPDLPVRVLLLTEEEKVKILYINIFLPTERKGRGGFDTFDTASIGPGKVSSVSLAIKSLKEGKSCFKSSLNKYHGKDVNLKNNIQKGAENEGKN